MAEGGRSSSGGQSGTVKPLHETVNDFQEGSEDTGGASLMEFCAQLDDCTPTVSYILVSSNWSVVTLFILV